LVSEEGKSGLQKQREGVRERCPMSLRSGGVEGRSHLTVVRKGAAEQKKKRMQGRSVFPERHYSLGGHNRIGIEGRKARIAT